jgi:hypothetical protein
MGSFMYVLVELINKQAKAQEKIIHKKADITISESGKRPYKPGHFPTFSLSIIK